MNKLKLEEFCLEREGHVGWSVFGPNHCGTVNHLHGGIIPIKWWSQLVCSGESLDSQGFLIDNMTVERHMKELAAVPSDLSCERLVNFCIESLVDRINREEPTCVIRSIAMWLSPEPYVTKMRSTYLPDKTFSPG